MRIPSKEDRRRAFARAYALVHGGGDDRAQSSVINSMVGITVSAIVIATIGTVGVNELADINLSNKGNWSDGSTSIFGIFDLIVVLAFLILLVGIALR